jgi:hypothetical protein
LLLHTREAEELDSEPGIRMKASTQKRWASVTLFSKPECLPFPQPAFDSLLCCLH